MRCFRQALFWAALLAMPAAGDGPGRAESPGALDFRFVGRYQLRRQVKLKDGKAFRVAIDPMVYRVYTDGVTIRLFGGEESEGFTAFTIYRNDGVLVPSSEAVFETVPGVQARSMVGNVLKQLNLTRARLTLTKFPAFSELVQVTYAARIPDEGGSRPQPPTIASP